jgi:penicillin-binding protein 2
LFEGGEHGRLAGRLAAQIIGAYVNKQRRLENNLLQVSAPQPAAPAGQPTAAAPVKAAGKPVEVGAIWSNPAAPDALGGRHVKPSRPQDAKGLAAIRGGHFFLSDKDTRTAGGTR